MFTFKERDARSALDPMIIPSVSSNIAFSLEMEEEASTSYSDEGDETEEIGALVAVTFDNI